MDSYEKLEEEAGSPLDKLDSHSNKTSRSMFHHTKDTSRHRYISAFALLSIILVYGSSLLVSQINALYINHSNAVANRHFILTKGEDNLHKEKAFSSGILQNNDNDNRKIPLSFDLVRKGTFIPESNEIQWIQSDTSVTNDTGVYLLTEGFNYTLKHLQDKSFTKEIFQGEYITFNGSKYEIETLTISNDLKHCLLITDKRHNWRHSFFANYWVYNIDTADVEPLYHEDLSLNKDISLAVLSPDSLKIAFVLNNNVFVKDLTTGEINQITYDGGEEIFYGKPDWVYEEEVLESDSAMYWSPDSKYLSILRSNDTQVPTFPIPYFVQQDNLDTSLDSSYPELRNIKYPKAGFPNPIVDIVIYDVSELKLIKLSKEEDVFYNDKDISNDDRLITEIKWVGNKQLLLRITNRESDILKIFIIDCLANKSQLVREEDFKGTKTWFEINHNLLFIPSDENTAIRKEDGYIDTINVDGYDHLGYFTPPTNPNPIILTSGQWEVVDGPVSFDSITNTVYFISTQKSSIERHLYSIDLTEFSNAQLEMPIMPKNITNVEEEAWYTVSFSTGSRYLLLNYNGPSVPYQKLIDLHENTEELLVSNDYLAKQIDKYDLPENKYGQSLKLVDDETKEEFYVNYKETLPLNFDPSKKYPLLMFVYGGPGSQLVQKTFSIASFSAIVASELDCVVVTVDGRGTGYKGKQFRNIVRDNLGHYEVLDQIQAAKHWINKPDSYIDPEKTAIWGWSYGGFMTLKTIEKDAGEVFKYGMSVAPVTNWKFYDSIYTERYMHTPQNNADGYTNSSIHDIDSFHNVTRFLLMHGTGDDNVHFQNSLKFLDMLDLNGVENYDVHVFPDSDHSIRYHNANVIVYDKLLTWLRRAFASEYVGIKSKNALLNEYEDSINMIDFL